MSECINCGKEPPQYCNYCNWERSIEHAKKCGGRVHCPNGLPVRSIKANGDMYEIEHGDHPDYKFPVHATYVGEHPEEHFTVSDAGGNNVEVDPGWVESRMHESHALIYTDGSIALTLYECSYAIWSLRDGKVIESQCWKRGEWQLTDESRAKINALKEQT